MALFGSFLKMKITLNEIADIKIGFTFRTSIEDQVEGNIRILQIRDMRAHTLIQSDILKLPKTVWEGRGEPPILQRGDVVLTARGENTRAAWLDCDEPVIASSQLFIIRLKRADILPAYLCWFLNNAEASRRHFEANSTGASMSALNKATVSSLPIHVVPLALQQQILAIQDVADQEINVLDQLKVNRQQMLKALFKTLLEK
jgi:hypothetical protein